MPRLIFFLVVFFTMTPAFLFLPHRQRLARTIETVT